MAEWKLSVASVAPDLTTTPSSNMWYAHNYAQRRTQARNVIRSHYAPDYAHDVTQEYAHAQPLVHEPFHVCPEHLPLSAADYSRPLHQYLAQYARTALQGHAYTTEHAHNTAHTLARSNARSARSVSHNAGHNHAHTIARTHGSRSAQSHAQTVGRSHAHTGGQSHAHTSGQSHAHTGGQSRAHTGGQSHAHTGSQGHAHTGGQNHAHTGGQSHTHTGSQGHAHTGGQNHAHTGGQNHAHTGRQGRAHTGGQNHADTGGQNHAHTGGQGHAHTLGRSQGHTSALTHVHTSGRGRGDTQGRPEEHLTPDHSLGRHPLRKVSHTSSRSHTHSIDQSHALTDDHALAHIRANTAEHGRANTAEHGRANTAEQGRTSTAEQGRAYTGEQGHTNTAEQGRAYSGEQGRAYSGEQGRAYSSEQGRANTGDKGRVYTVGESQVALADHSLMDGVDLTSLYPFTGSHSYSHGFRYINEQANRVRPPTAREQTNQARPRTQEQSYRARPHTQEQGYRARPHAQEQAYRARPHAHDMWAFYPESAQSSEEEEESVLEDDVRVDLPYTHHQCRGRSGGREEYGPGRSEHIIRRFHDPGEACEEDPDVSTVGLSYQQRADVCHTRGHTGSTVALADVGEGVGRRRGGLLLAEGLVREWVRAVGVVAASGTLVTLVLLGFGVYNMLITTLFLLFVLTTVALLIFLLMRRPPCCPCCQDPYDTSASAAGSTGSQAANITYLTETHGIVVKKWMKDSPPPYESPPDYNSLSPELIMDAKSLQELVNTSQTPTQTQGLSAGVHNPTTSAGNQGRSPSPLCTTPLFSPSFCDSPRSLTPTMHQESKLLGVYDRPPSPIFTHHQYPSSTSTHCHPSTTAPLTVPSAVYGQPAATPPPYDSLRLYPHDGGRRKEDNQ